MNDFSDLETQLKALRPTPLREDFVARVEAAMAAPEPVDEPAKNIVRPFQFRRQWLAGLGLAAAAVLLLLLRVNFHTPDTIGRTASVSPAPTSAPAETVHS